MDKNSRPVGDLVYIYRDHIINPLMLLDRVCLAQLVPPERLENLETR